MMVEAAKAIQISYPYVIISIHMDATHEIIMRVKMRKPLYKTILLSIIFQKATNVIDKDTILWCHEQLHNVTIIVVHRNTLKGIVVCITANAIHC